MQLHELAPAFEAEAEYFGKYELASMAKLAAEHAEQVRLALEGSLEQALDIPQSARESGYSRANLRLLIREKKIPNAGTPEEPKILRKNLPRKPGFGVVWPEQDPSVAGKIEPRPSSRSQIARAAASGKR